MTNRPIRVIRDRDRDLPSAMGIGECAREAVDSCRRVAGIVLAGVADSLEAVETNHPDGVPGALARGAGRIAAMAAEAALGEK